ncbi:MAG: KH domain-containing protein [Cyanobacteria bacterium J06638_20]
MSDVTPPVSSTPESAPLDFQKLVTFLVAPFLESPDSLRVDCEVRANRKKVLIRMAFEGEDKGRVFGRGGRNVQAIRTVLQGIGKLSEYDVYLEVFGSPAGGRDNDSSGGGHRSSRPDRRSRPSRPRPRH